MTLRQRLGLSTPPLPRDEPAALAPRPSLPERRPEWLVRREERLRTTGRVAERDLTNAG